MKQPQNQSYRVAPMLSMLSTSSRTLAGQRLAVRRLICALFFVSGLEQTVIVPLLPHFASHYHLSASESALVLALPGLTMLLVSVPAGVLADRFGPRRVTLASGLLLAIAGVLQALPSLTALVCGRVLFGVAFGVLWTAGVAWLSRIPAEEKVAEAQDDASGGTGGAIVWSSIGTLVGPGLAGLVAQRAGAGLPFALSVAGAIAVCLPLAVRSRALAFAGSTVPVTRAPDFRPSAPRRLGAWLRRPTIAWRELTLPSPQVAAAAGSLVITGALSSGTQLLVTRGLHADGLSTGRIGLIFSLCAVIYVAVSAAVVRIGPRVVTPWFNAIVAALGAASLVPALLGGGAPLLIVALMLTALPRGAINVVAYALPGRSGGSVFGALNGVWGAATVLTPVAAGAAVQHGGLQGGLLMVILPTGAIAVALLIGARALPRSLKPVCGMRPPTWRPSRVLRLVGLGGALVLPRALGRFALRRVRVVKDLQTAQFVERDVAADAVTRLLLDKLGFRRLADVADLARATGLEGTAAGRVRGAGDLALETDPEMVEVVEGGNG
jgi:MFS family permease